MFTLGGDYYIRGSSSSSSNSLCFDSIQSEEVGRRKRKKGKKNLIDTIRRLDRRPMQLYSFSPPIVIECFSFSLSLSLSSCFFFDSSSAHPRKPSLLHPTLLFHRVDDDKTLLFSFLLLLFSSLKKEEEVFSSSSSSFSFSFYLRPIVEWWTAGS